MSEEREQTSLESKANDSAQTPAEDEDDVDVGSPFDHPAFLPVLLWALSLWFGYDGFINQDPEMLEHRTFNQYGFGLLVLAAIYFTVQGVRDQRAASEEDPSATHDR